MRELPLGDRLAWSASSKCARAFDLAAGRQVLAEKASAIALSREMSLRTAFRAIAWNCLRHIVINYPGIVEHRNAEAVHQMRVALRRQRIAASIFGRAIGHRPPPELRAQWKAVGEVLGRGRMLDVLMDGISADETVKMDGANGVLALLRQVRERRYDEIVGLVGSRSFQDMLFCTGIWIEEAEERPTMPLGSFAARTLKRMRRRLAKDSRQLAKLGIRKRHRLRMRLKRFRYATEFFASLFVEKPEKAGLGKLLSAQEKLQNRLGELNDLAVLGHAKTFDLEPLNAIDRASVSAFLMQLNRTRSEFARDLKKRAVRAGKRLAKLAPVKSGRASLPPIEHQ